MCTLSHTYTVMFFPPARFIFENASRESRSLGVALNFKNLRRCIHKRNQQWPSVNIEARQLLLRSVLKLFASSSSPSGVDSMLLEFVNSSRSIPACAKLTLHSASSILRLHIYHSTKHSWLHRSCSTAVSHWNWGTVRADKKKSRQLKNILVDAGSSRYLTLKWIFRFILMA